MTASPGATYTNDLAGNRLTKTVGSVTNNYTWDSLNRLTKTTVGGGYVGNLYRPDGLLHRKIVKEVTTQSGSGYGDFNTFEDNPTYFYRYDGQMTFEEEANVTVRRGSSPWRDDVTRYTLGARGIDMIEAERVESTDANDPLLNVKTRVYPVYDGHGNMAATLKKSGTNNYTLANEKRYEAWGAVRYDQGVTGSDHVINPKTRYCANLGHSDDGYTGLTYMRARWYDASTGRFISQDPAADGWNWFVYVQNSPIGLVDSNGQEADQMAGAFEFFLRALKSVGIEYYSASAMAIIMGALFTIAAYWLAADALQLAGGVMIGAGASFLTSINMFVGAGLAMAGLITKGASIILRLYALYTIYDMLCRLWLLADMDEAYGATPPKLPEL